MSITQNGQCKKYEKHVDPRRKGWINISNKNIESWLVSYKKVESLYMTSYKSWVLDKTFESTVPVKVLGSANSVGKDKLDHQN